VSKKNSDKQIENKLKVIDGVILKS
jgi:hypothetical protein